MSAVADVLNGAADLIERDGWAQGPIWQRGPKLCAGVAIMKATNSVRLQSSAAGALCREVGCTLIPEWNDMAGRTEAQVVAALRSAAERAS